MALALAPGAPRSGGGPDRRGDLRPSGRCGLHRVPASPAGLAARTWSRIWGQCLMRSLARCSVPPESRFESPTEWPVSKNDQMHHRDIDQDAQDILDDGWEGSADGAWVARQATENSGRQGPNGVCDTPREEERHGDREPVVTGADPDRWGGDGAQHQTDDETSAHAAYQATQPSVAEGQAPARPPPRSGCRWYRRVRPDPPCSERASSSPQAPFPCVGLLYRARCRPHWPLVTRSRDEAPLLRASNAPPETQGPTKPLVNGA